MAEKTATSSQSHGDSRPKTTPLTSTGAASDFKAGAISQSTHSPHVSKNVPTLPSAPSRTATPKLHPDKLEMAQFEIRKLKDENDGLKQERDEVYADLEHCKETLFALQLPGQVSDDRFQKDLERIQGAIDGLVYDIMVDARDDAMYTIWKQPRKDHKKRRAAEIIEKSQMRAWAHFTCSNFLILSTIIQWILDKYIFQQRYPLSISPDEIVMIEEVENSMKQSGHTNAPVNISRWRSETLTALVTRPDNEKKIMAKAKVIHRRAENVLSQWLDGDVSSSGVRLAREILDPAIKLHQDLQISIDRFHMDSPNLRKELSTQQMIQQWQIRDIESWAVVKRENQVGVPLCCLHPALIRFRVGDGSSLVLTRPVVITRPRAPTERTNDSSARAGRLLNTATREANHRIQQYYLSPDRQDSVEVESEDSPSSAKDEDEDSDTASSKLSSPLHSYKPLTRNPGRLTGNQSPQVNLSKSPAESQTYTRELQVYERYGEGAESGSFRRAATHEIQRRGSKDASSEISTQARSNDDKQRRAQTAPPSESGSTSTIISAVRKKFLGANG